MGFIGRTLKLYVKPTLRLVSHPRSFDEAVSMYRRGIRNGRFLATLPRSGTNYLKCVLASALDIRDGGDGEYVFENNGWRHRQEPFGSSVYHNFVEVLRQERKIHPDFIWFGHHPIQAQNMFPTSRMRIVFTVRDIHPQIESWVVNTAKLKKYSNEEFFNHGYVEKVIDYFNYWGDYIEAHGLTLNRDIVCLRYEDLTREPMAALDRINAFWGLGLDERTMGRAVHLCGRESMLARIPDSEKPANQRVSVRSNRGDVLTAEQKAYVDRIIKSRLRHSFGYSFG